MKKLFLSAMVLFFTQESFATKRNLEGDREENPSKILRQTSHQEIPDDIYTIIFSFCPDQTLLDARLANSKLLKLSTQELRERYWTPAFTVLFSKPRTSSNRREYEIKGASCGHGILKILYDETYKLYDNANNFLGNEKLHYLSL